jgi:hypothetical protein
MIENDAALEEIKTALTHVARQIAFDLNCGKKVPVETVELALKIYQVLAIDTH